MEDPWECSCRFIKLQPEDAQNVEARNCNLVNKNMMHMHLKYICYICHSMKSINFEKYQRSNLLQYKRYVKVHDFI